MALLAPISRTFNHWLASALAFGGLIFLFTTVMTVIAQAWLTLSSTPSGTKSLEDYTFIENDYPAHYPIDLPDVLLAPESTKHYRIWTPNADVEWGSIFPPGGGFLTLGADPVLDELAAQRDSNNTGASTNGRMFGLSLFHQLHCLDRIRSAIHDGTPTGHVHHCFNYLRQAMLCEADATLEPMIMISGVQSTAAGFSRTCKDWTKVYDLVKENDDMMHGLVGRRASVRGGETGSVHS